MHLPAWVAWVTLCLCVVACSSNTSNHGDGNDDDGSVGAAADLSSMAAHIAGGIEMKHQLATTGSVADKQRASVHFGNAYWLAGFTFLTYNPDDVIRQSLNSDGFDGQNVRFFENTCTGGFAMYIPAKDSSYGVLVFRGTQSTVADWALDFKSPRIPWPGAGTIHWGFHDRFVSLWNDDASCGVAQGVYGFLKARHAIDPSTGKSKGGSLYVIGHSMGAALATLALAYTQAEVCGADKACTKDPMIPISALYTFGSPKVGDEAFSYAVADLAKGRTAIFRFVNGNDLVTGIPTDLDPLEMLYDDYRHVGPSNEIDDVLEVWMQDKQLEVAMDDSRTKWNFADHGVYIEPLKFQAQAHNQLH